jgi:hypothetical protein
VEKGGRGSVTVCKPVRFLKPHRFIGTRKFAGLCRFFSDITKWKKEVGKVSLFANL